MFLMVSIISRIKNKLYFLSSPLYSKIKAN